MKLTKSNCSFNREIRIGTKIEMEHKGLFPKPIQKQMARKIALNHIHEFPCYYSKGLLPMEKKLMRLNK